MCAGLEGMRQGFPFTVNGMKRKISERVLLGLVGSGEDFYSDVGRGWIYRGLYGIILTLSKVATIF